MADQSKSINELVGRLHMDEDMFGFLYAEETGCQLGDSVMTDREQERRDGAVLRGLHELLDAEKCSECHGEFVDSRCYAGWTVPSDALIVVCSKCYDEAEEN